MATTIGLKLDDKTRERLQRLGDLKKRSPHWLMKRAVSEFLDREEVYEREKAEDLARWRTYEETGEALTQEEMLAFLDGLALKSQDAERE